MAARTWVLWMHLGIGAAAGLLMSLTALTGSLLVFGEEIDRLLNPALLRVEPGVRRVSLDEVVTYARSALGNRRIDRIHLPLEPRASLEVCVAAREDPPCLYVNPYTGARLGVRSPTRSFKGRLLSFHRRLCAGIVGETIVGIAGALLISLSLTGLILWADARRPIWRRRSTATAPPYVRRLDLHRRVGLCALPALLLVAATGTAMIYRPTFEGTLNHLASRRMPDPPLVRSVSSAGAISLDAVLRRIRMSAPDAQPTAVILPASPMAALTVRARMRGEWLPKGRSVIYVHPHTGALIRSDSALESPLGYRMGSALYPLHTGLIGGMPVRLFQAFLGLVPAVLSWTGMLMWWRRAIPMRYNSHRTARHR